MFAYSKQESTKPLRDQWPDRAGKRSASARAIKLQALDQRAGPVKGDGVVQRAWIKGRQDEDYTWHALRNGVRWYCGERGGLLYYRVEKQAADPKLREFYDKYRDCRMKREQWVQLMAEVFQVDAALLEDKNDPVYDEPQFLINEEDRRKMALAKELSERLRLMGFRPFLGGAAAATLITRTRPINDLDFRLDGLERNLFHKDSKDKEMARKLLDMLSSIADDGVVTYAERGLTTVKCKIHGIDVSITSEPSVDEVGAGPLTLSRGEMVSGIESNGEFTFLLDKARAVAGRVKMPKSVVTDLYDMVMILEYNPGSRYILQALRSIEGDDVFRKFRIRLQAVKSRSPKSEYMPLIIELVGGDKILKKAFFDQLDSMYELAETQVDAVIL